MWDRKRRQYLCGAAPSVKDTLDYENYACMQSPDDLRDVVCENKANKTLIEVLKTDLECGWGLAARMYGNFFVVAVLAIIAIRV